MAQEHVTRTAIVLAAGHGTRMGGPKVRLIVPEGPLVALHVQRFVDAHCTRVVVVTRPECAAFVESVAPQATVFGIATEEPAASLAAGVMHGPLGDVVFVAPVDTIPASIETLAALGGAVSRGALAASPIFRGLGGHPVACARSMLAPYAAAGPWPPLRDRLHELASARAVVEVSDPAIHSRLDTPADFERAFATPPRFG